MMAPKRQNVRKVGPDQPAWAPAARAPAAAANTARAPVQASSWRRRAANHRSKVDRANATAMSEAATATAVSRECLIPCEGRACERLHELGRSLTTMAP